MIEEITEARLVQNCVEWFRGGQRLCLGKIYLWHNNPRNAIAGSRLKSQGMKRGPSDLVLFTTYLQASNMPSIIYFLEAKLQGQTQKKEQIEFMTLVQSSGHKYMLFHSLEEFQRICRDIGIAQH